MTRLLIAFAALLSLSGIGLAAGLSLDPEAEIRSYLADVAPEARIIRTQGIVIIDAIDPSGPVYYSEPLTEAAPDIIGRSLEELIGAAPLHPPVEGLPPEYWQNQTCAGCHQWDQDTLCTQAEFYTTDSGQNNLLKLHPFGGSFKRNLRVWAQGGCQ